MGATSRVKVGAGPAVAGAAGAGACGAVSTAVIDTAATRAAPANRTNTRFMLPPRGRRTPSAWPDCGRRCYPTPPGRAARPCRRSARGRGHALRHDVGDRGHVQPGFLVVLDEQPLHHQGPVLV